MFLQNFSVPIYYFVIQNKFILKKVNYFVTFIFHQETVTKWTQLKNIHSTGNSNSMTLWLQLIKFI